MTQLSPSSTKVLLAVLSLERPTVRQVAFLLGRSTSTVHASLRILRREGLVSWEDGQRGTLHPLVRAVPFGRAA